LRGDFKTVQEGHQRGQTAFLGEPGECRQFCPLGEPREGSEARKRKVYRVQRRDPEIPDGLETIQCSDQCRPADTGGTSAKLIHQGPAPTSGHREQGIYPCPLFGCDPKAESTIETCGHTGSQAGHKFHQHRSAGKQNLAGKHPPLGSTEENARPIHPRPTQSIEPSSHLQARVGILELIASTPGPVLRRVRPAKAAITVFRWAGHLQYPKLLGEGTGHR
jgi:hypothetical protein